MIIGHEKIIAFFETAITNGLLAHTYCFVGPSHVGKRTVARALSAKILGVSPEKLSSEPNFHYLERAVDEKTDKLKKEISVSQARELRASLRNSAWGGGYQVLIIDEAEKFNEESGNALLKILEEPPEKSVFFLLTEDDRTLISTIRSRAQLLFFSLVAENEIAKGLGKMGYTVEKSNEAALNSWGRPGQAIRWITDETWKEDFTRDEQVWQKILGQPLYAKVKVLEKVFSDLDKEDSVRGRERLMEMLNRWVVLTEKNMHGIVRDGHSATREMRIIDNLFRAIQLLQKNAHPRLTVEQALLEV